MKQALMAALAVCLSFRAVAASLDLPHVRVSYEGVSEAHARAIGQTIEEARRVYVEEFALDMPQIVKVSVKCGPAEKTRLYTDGNDSVFLSVATAGQLDRPEKSGVFNLYGLCHELGHVAMYRVLKERSWMSGGAAEGWAHYAGSVVVDRLYEARGEKLWPDAYDYRQDGTRRLERQLASSAPSEIARAAGMWKELEGITGRKGMAAIFIAWEKSDADLASPLAKLRASTLDALPGKAEQVERWWKGAEGLFVEARRESGFRRIEVKPADLANKPVVLAGDDGAADARRSIAGAGHARKFESPGGQWHLRSVSIHAARYGAPNAPATTFDLALCDEQMRVIASWKRPYGAFERGESKWVKLDVPPTRAPAVFYVCLDFKPTASSGVYVSVDAGTKGGSQVTTPGKTGPPLAQGDWMIRVEVDPLKGADALKE